MEKAYKFLKNGEDTQKGDEFFDVRANCWFKVTGSYTVGICHSPVRREINVIEIPAIPDGFRELTQEDIDNHARGELMYSKRLKDKTIVWDKLAAKAYHLSLECMTVIIIKPASKGIDKNNYKPGMKFRKKFMTLTSSDADTFGLVLSSKREEISFDTLNRDYQVFDERKGSWIFCSEYKE